MHGEPLRLPRERICACGGSRCCRMPPPFGSREGALNPRNTDCVSMLWFANGD